MALNEHYVFRCLVYLLGLIWPEIKQGNGNRVACAVPARRAFQVLVLAVREALERQNILSPLRLRRRSSVWYITT